MIYLIHFETPIKHARHYLGYTENLSDRLERHLAGQGARLMEVVSSLGIPYQLARTWDGGRALERRLKQRKNAPALCPICAGEKALQRAKNL